MLTAQYREMAERDCTKGHVTQPTRCQPDKLWAPVFMAKLA
jgi:hypothetical protein